MVQEVRVFAVTVPAGTLLTAPQTTNLPIPPRIVTGVRIRVPPGPSGSVGFALGAAGVRVIPWGPNQWIVADGEVIDWPLEDQIETGAWQVQAYNTGRWDHTIQFQFLLRALRKGESAPDLLVPIDLTA